MGQINGAGLLAGMRFVVAESEWAVALSVEKILREAGAEVVGVAGNAGDSLGMIEAKEIGRAHV